MGTLMIEEEYWTTQYLTTVLGHREPIFWPLDGEGKFGTEADATRHAEYLLRRPYPEARVVHVIRKMRYAQPITESDLLPDGS
ncbi:MAG: hypothetical protein ABW046_22680 [Actinoplanes sp.]